MLRKNERPLVAVILVYFAGTASVSTLTLSSYVSSADEQRLSKVFADGLAKDDVDSISYSIMGLKLTGAAAPPHLCGKLQEYLSGGDVAIASISDAVAAAKDLPDCKVQLGSAAKEAVNAALDSDKSLGNLYHAVLTSVNLGQAIDKAKISKLLQSGLRRDDGVVNLGYGFNLATHLNEEDVLSVFDWIEVAVALADEVDEKILYFEGGLSTVRLVVEGVYKLADKAAKPPPISKDQAVMLANYLLTRKSVKSPKGAFFLLSTLKAMSENKYNVPVAVNLQSSSSLSKSNPKIRVKVTDIFGKSLGNMKVEVESAVKTDDDAVVLLSNSKMTQVPDDETVYEIDVFAANPGRGFYDLTVTADPVNKEERLAGNEGAKLRIKRQSDVSLEDVEFGVGDADRAVPAKVNTLDYPSKAGSAAVDQHHRITLKFSVKDEVSGEKIRVHQTFVSLVNAATGEEVVYVAESSEGNRYSFELDFGKAKELAGKSGKYRVRLIVGDALVSNLISWNFADLDLSLPKVSDSKKLVEKNDRARPEIKHLFRQPEKRPSEIVSNVFTALCLLPLLFLMVGWAKVGVNLSNFPVSVTAIGFHVSLGAIFTLYYFFWLKMNMFTTVKYLFMIGVVAFLCGNSMLAGIAIKKKAK